MSRKQRLCQLYGAKGYLQYSLIQEIYPDLHSTRDDVEKIDFDKMERVSKMVFLIGYDIANQKKRFVSGDRFNDILDRILILTFILLLLNRTFLT